MHMSVKTKIAIVYDWIDKWGGVERVLLTLHKIFPAAIFYTSYFDPEKAAWAKNLNIETSFIQKLPDFIKKNRILSLPFYPLAFESIDLSEYDVVISVTSSFAKSVMTKPDTLHICYLLTPTRFLWVDPRIYLKNNIVRSLFLPYLTKLRSWDFIAAQRPDYILSIAKNVADRVEKYYRRKSEVVYPPFDIEHWKQIKKSKIPTSSAYGGIRGTSKKQKANLKFKIITSKYFLLVSRLEAYKKVDLAINVFNQLADKTLIVVGEGGERPLLKRQARKNILFLEKLTDEELGYLYSKAEALIIPQEEDLGYVSLEAQYFACPVIAYKRGGAQETVLEEKTGIFFANQTGESLRTALERFDKIAYNLKGQTRKWSGKNLERFREEIFREKLISYINSAKNK